jgi:hypothetical protein
VTRAVIDDVAEELDGVERALRGGDLTGRARQAVERSRLDVSPVQIVAADRLLHQVPMGSERLFTEVEPTAAAVAAAHWLQSAVDVTLEVTGWEDAAAVLEAADAIESFDVTTTQVVLDLLRLGNPPIAAVQCLVRTAMLAARGMILHGSPEPADDPLDEAASPCSTRRDRPVPCSNASPAPSRPARSCTPSTSIPPCSPPTRGRTGWRPPGRCSTLRCASRRSGRRTGCSGRGRRTWCPDRGCRGGSTRPA